MKSGKPSTQVVGNTGLYYVCYELSRRGWNVLPTSRNARGVDIVVYSQNGVRKHTVQVKTLSQRAPIPLGSHIEHLIADFVAVCVLDSPPQVCILPTEQLKQRPEIVRQAPSAAETGFWAVNSRGEWRLFEQQYLDNWDCLGSGY